MKIYMIILDGAADRKIEILANRTPLQVANTPSLDTLVKRGKQTLITVIDDNIIPESDSGSMALLSYNPKTYYPGRGTLEGLGTDFIDKKEFLENYFMVIAYTDNRIINIKNYISVDEIVNYEFDYIYICTFKHYKEIKKSL